MNQEDIETWVGRYGSRRQLDALKKIYVRRAAAGNALYIETNHQFVKTFSDIAALEFRGKLRVVHLVRDPVSVATSFFRIGSIPGHTERGKVYLLDPMREGNQLDMSHRLRREKTKDRQFLSCLWYWYEVEARALDFVQRHPEVDTYTLRTADLNDLGRLMRMFSALKIDVDETQVRKVVGTHTNTRVSEKSGALDRAFADSLHDTLCGWIRDDYGDERLKALQAAIGA